MNCSMYQHDEYNTNQSPSICDRSINWDMSLVVCPWLFAKRWRQLLDGIIQPLMATLVYRPHLRLFVIFLQLISSVAAFSSSPSSINNQPSTLPHKNIKNCNTVQISKVQTNNDILSLAKLRYQEWMINEVNPPLLSNFCKATAEIYNERKVDGSIVFLANWCIIMLAVLMRW